MNFTNKSNLAITIKSKNDRILKFVLEKKRGFKNLESIFKLIIDSDELRLSFWQYIEPEYSPQIGILQYELGDEKYVMESIEQRLEVFRLILDFSNSSFSSRY